MRERVYTQKNTRKKKRNKNNDAQKKAAVSGNFRSRIHAKKKRCTKKRGVRGECESACTQTACTKCTKKEMVKKRGASGNCRSRVHAEKTTSQTQWSSVIFLIVQEQQHWLCEIGTINEQAKKIKQVLYTPKKVGN